MCLPIRLSVSHFWKVLSVCLSLFVLCSLREAAVSGQRISTTHSKGPHSIVIIYILWNLRSKVPAPFYLSVSSIKHLLIFVLLSCSTLRPRRRFSKNSRVSSGSACIILGRPVVAETSACAVIPICWNSLTGESPRKRTCTFACTYREGHGRGRGGAGYC